MVTVSPQHINAIIAKVQSGGVGERAEALAEIQSILGVQYSTLGGYYREVGEEMFGNKSVAVAKAYVKMAEALRKRIRSIEKAMKLALASSA